MTACFHCGERVPQGCDLTAAIEGVAQPMCCIGCQAVAQFLSANNHEVFYQYRADKLPAEQVDAEQGEWTHLDAAEVFAALTRPLADGLFQVTIKVEGMYCNACGWLLQKVFQARAGISELRINTVTQNVQFDFNPEQIKLSELFAQIQQLGYHPLQQQSANTTADDERKKQLKRIAVAGFGMMFIMTLAVPLYSPDEFAVAPHIQRFFLMISLLIATLVYFYAGQGFIQNAIRDVKNRHLGMDVPVALSISLAYFVSLYLSFKQSGHVYFDSMAMFVFFLLLGRFVESQVRHQGMNVRESLFALVPVSAEKVLAGQTVTVPLSQIEKGDHLQVRAGGVMPCDGQIIQGSGQMNEAILTGESALIDKRVGDDVFAGAQLSSGDLVIETTVNNQDSFLAKLADLMELAQSKKPPSLQLVDQLASYFVAGVLVLALATATWYGLNRPDAMMTAVLSVLIATCPCALSLATPTALTAAGVNLLKQGVLVNNTEAITQLDQARHWFFDKTGTLSEDKLSIKHTHLLEDEVDVLAVAASLQQISNHPIASAFYAPTQLTVKQAEEFAGQGVAGVIDQQRWFMGSRQWINSMQVAVPEVQAEAGLTLVYLVREQRVVAVFELMVPVRAGVPALLKTLQTQQRDTTVISGDQVAVVNNWAQRLGIKAAHGGLPAQDKIKYIAAQQAQGTRCVMVGDGVNDAPVLSQADVSISLKQGAYLAHSASDMIVLGKSLAPLSHALSVSAKTQAIIKQNLLWSLVYNLSVTPAAMMGLLAPWMAAIGMSLSSLLVVFNSRRLL